MLYRDQIGETQNPPPYSFPGVKINSFRLKADLNKLQELCDRVLNVGDLEQRGFENFGRYFHLSILRSCTIRKCYTRIFRSAALFPKMSVMCACL
jgi:hypothetical protein